MAKTLHYPFSTAPSLTDIASGVELAITRATKATMVDADGYIREVQDGKARFPGASFNQNLFLQSQTLDNAWWTKTRSSISADVVTDPDGGTSADKLVEDSTALSTHRIDSSVLSVGIGKTYIFSIYAKAAERSEFQFAISAAGFPNNTSAWFDLSAGTVGTVKGTGASATISDVGNGWYRASIITTADQTIGTANCVILLGSGSETSSYDGDGSSGAYFYGAQFEDVSGAWDSENLLLQSNDFGDVVWNATAGITITSGQPDPDGGSTAFLLANPSPSGADNVNITQAGLPALPTSGAIYRQSLYVKKFTSDWFYFELDNFTYPPNNTRQWFNISTGTVGTGTAAVVDAGIEDVGGGWYRCWFDFQPQADIAGVLRLSLADADGDSTPATAVGLYMWHPQLERTKPSQTTPGTYVATTTAAVTNYSPSTYTPTTTAAVTSLSGANDGLLVEEARTNICLQSEDFNTTWSGPVNTVVNTNVTTAPDGTTTADRIIDDNSGGSATPHRQQVVTVIASTTYTFSLFAKADQLSWVVLGVEGFTTPVNSLAWFDLSNGVVGTVNAGFDDSGIEDYGNGWYRVWVSFTTDVADTNGDIAIYMDDADNDGRTVDLDGTSSIFVWGAQLEAGAFPTSYIPTTTGTVTRNADTVNTTDVSWYNSSAGTFYAHMQASGVSASDYIYDVGDGSASDYWHLRADDSTHTNIRIASDSTTYVVYDSAAVLGVGDGAAHRLSAASTVDDFSSYADGGVLYTDSSVTMPVGVSKLNIGSRTNGDALHWNGLIKEIAYFDERLDNEDLNTLSLSGPAGIAGGGGGVYRGRRARDASLWYQQMRLKQDDDEAVEMIKKYLN